MEAMALYKSPRVVEAVRVSILNVAGRTDSEVVDFACATAREERSSLYGWSINRVGNIAGVELYRD